MPIRNSLLTLLAALVALASVSPLPAAEVELDADASLVAVVTHKAGLGARLAHNHLVALPAPDVAFDYDAADPTASRFSLRFASENLVVDRGDLQSTWYPMLEAWGVLDEPFSEISDKDRGKIRKAMLGDDQLDAETHPEIAVRLVRLEPGAPEGAPSEAFDWRATVALTLVGKTVEIETAASANLEGQELTVEAVGQARFSDFGIEPYSALLGAVRNDDGFHLVLHLEGIVASNESPAVDGSTTPGDTPSP